MDLTLAICVYNAEKYLEETLRSVLAQSVQDFFLLIINDASTDNSMKIIEDFFTEHPRQYELINLPENKGICYARQKALESAQTKYLIFVDSDDILKPELLEKLKNKIQENSDMMAVTCYSEFINMKGQKIAGGTFLGVKSKEEFTDKAKKGKRFFMPIHTIFDRELALKAGGFVTEGFPEGKPRYQDYCEELDLWTRMSDFYTQGKYFATVPEVLYQYRKNEGLSSNHFIMMLKMKYTKTNVKRRRAGKNNLTFIDFYNSLSAEEMRKLRKEAQVADDLRNGVFLIKSGNFIKGSMLIERSLLKNPNYFFEKIKNNFFKK